MGEEQFASFLSVLFPEARSVCARAPKRGPRTLVYIYGNGPLIQLAHNVSDDDSVGR